MKKSMPSPLRSNAFVVTTAAAPVRHFCTYFDINFALRGLTLLRSLERTSGNFVLHVLALDDKTIDLIERLGHPRVRLVAIRDLERRHAVLDQAKQNRSRIEYYFTLSPFLPLDILESDPTIDSVTYLDADLHFHSSPDPIFLELGDASVLVCEHRYATALQDHIGYGRFNVQFLIFRNNTVGLSCLRRWRDQCAAWCFDRLEDGKYGDQKYLDEWPELLGPELVVARHPGAGVAPWNIDTFPIEVTDAGKVRIEGAPLIFYHFHGLKIFSRRLASNGLADWGRLSRRAMRAIYHSYIRDLRHTQAWVKETSGILVPMRDNFARGGRPGIGNTWEIARKAWIQGLFVP